MWKLGWAKFRRNWGHWWKWGGYSGRNGGNEILPQETSKTGSVGKGTGCLVGLREAVQDSPVQNLHLSHQPICSVSRPDVMKAPKPGLALVYTSFSFVPCVCALVCTSLCDMGNMLWWWCKRESERHNKHASAHCKAMKISCDMLEYLFSIFRIYSQYVLTGNHWVFLIVSQCMFLIVRQCMFLNKPMYAIVCAVCTLSECMHCMFLIVSHCMFLIKPTYVSDRKPLYVSDQANVCFWS